MRRLRMAIIVTVLLAGSSLSAQTHPGQVARSIPIPSPCPAGIAAAGDRLWVVDRFTDKIYELDRESGKVRRELDAPCYQPMGLTVDEAGKAAGQKKIYQQTYRKERSRPPSETRTGWCHEQRIVSDGGGLFLSLATEKAVHQ